MNVYKSEFSKNKIFQQLSLIWTVIEMQSNIDGAIWREQCW